MTASDGWTAQYHWHVQFQSQEKMSFFQNCYWEAPAWKCVFIHCCRLLSQKGNNIVWLPAKMYFMKIEIQFQCCQLQYIDGIDDTPFDAQVCESPSWEHSGTGCVRQQECHCLLKEPPHTQSANQPSSLKDKQILPPKCHTTLLCADAALHYYILRQGRF